MLKPHGNGLYQLNHGRESHFAIERSGPKAPDERTGLVRRKCFFDVQIAIDSNQLQSSDVTSHLLAIIASISDAGTTPPCPPAIRPGAIPSFFKPS